MKVDLDSKSIEVTVFEHRKNNYEYFIGNVQIGEIDTNVVKYDNIIMRQNSIVRSLEKLGVLEKEQQEKQNTLENELSAKIKDQIDNLSREEIRKSAKETQGIDRYIEEQRIERNRIRDVRILELKKEDRKKEETKREAAKKNAVIESKKDEQQKQEKSTIKDINVKQELYLDERANDIHSIRKWLGGQVPHSISKIGVIESDQMDEMKNEKGQKYKSLTTRYSLVAIGKDGTVEPLQKYIPQLRQRSASGNNPMAQKYQVRDDGSVEKDSILSEFEIGDKIIQIDNKEMGRIEVNIGEEAKNSTETVGVQLRDSNTIFATDTSQRSVVIGEYKENGEYAVKSGLEEIERHFERDKDCTKATEADIDGDKRTKSEHVKEHIAEMKDAYIEKMARKILDENPELGETYNQTDIENKLKNKMQKESLTKKDLENNIDEITENIKQEAEEERLPSDDDRMG